MEMFINSFMDSLTNHGESWISCSELKKHEYQYQDWEYIPLLNISPHSELRCLIQTIA